MNQLGQRTDLSTSFDLGSGIDANPGDTAWGYDDLGQVISAAAPGTDADRYFSYDAIGNRFESRIGTATDSGGTLTEYFGALTPTTVPGANNLNQYLGIKTGSTTIEPGYDDDGNTTAYPVPAYPTENSALVWDAENRLISTTVNSVTTTRLYDAQSRRIATTTGGITTLYIYDGWNVVAEYGGSVGVSTALTKTYTWGLDLSGTLQGAGGVGGLLTMSLITNNSITDNYYPTYDGNGNVSEYLTADGSTAAHFEYDPFGNTVVNTDTNNQFAYRFSTKPSDPTTGFYYYGYRWYDPVTGRWPSRDPIGERGGINLYGFVENDSIVEFDVFGLWHGGTHKELTHASLRRAIEMTPEWPENCTEKVTNLLIAQNLSQDRGAAFEELSRHFNRKVTGESKKSDEAINAKNDYTNYLNSEIESLLFQLDRVDPNSSINFSAGCSLALASLGRLAHSWQDYYAHSVALFPGKNNHSWKLWTAEPSISGSPDDMNPRISPSSWKHWLWNRGEHGALEPYGLEGQKRRDAAETFVADKLKSYLAYWAYKCSCTCNSLSY